MKNNDDRQRGKPTAGVDCDMAFAGIQVEALELSAKNGWNHDTASRLARAFGELEELAVEVSGHDDLPSVHTARALGHEAYDLCWNLCDLANKCGVNLEKATARGGPVLVTVEGMQRAEAFRKAACGPQTALAQLRQRMEALRHAVHASLAQPASCVASEDVAGCIVHTLRALARVGCAADVRLAPYFIEKRLINQSRTWPAAAATVSRT